ncbi:hypothetical protein [Porphyrobacter sp. LM 6]|uniref:hypothetical protein n=1 Tax=Porphyrobacter sp. LM 6 TaxID=1896196 RepID=UPI000847C396|nr:hypothetical protein [Porphyrobacter sp. LM 6]
MIVLQGYLALTVFIYAFGPWPWPTKRPEILYLFLIVVQIALLIGYGIGLKAAPRAYDGRWRVKTLIKISLFLNLIWILPNFASRSGQTAVSWASLIQQVVMGLSDPGQSYRDRIEAAANLQDTSALGYLTQVVSPLLWLMTPLCVYFWSSIPRSTKILFVAVVSVDLITWVALGTNKGVFDFALMLPCLILAARPHLIARMSGVTVIKGALAVALIGGLLFAQFSTSLKGRAGGEVSAFDYSAGIALDFDNWLIAPLPSGIQASAGALMSYTSQGYYPLSLALNEPFVFSKGVGNSYYYTGIVQSFTGPDTISDLTYPARIEYLGWSRWTKWHTIYTWIASDLSFIGVPFFVFAIGFLLARTWRDSLVCANPFAIALLPLLVLMVFYFPANNQVLGFSRTANAFFALLFLWLFTRRRVRQ